MTYSGLFDEKKLLQCTAKGDEKAFAIIFNYYHQILGAYIFRITNSTELTQDIVQEVFTKIWLNRQELNSVISFKAYLFVIAKNHAINQFKKFVKEQTFKEQWQLENMQRGAIDAPDDYYRILDEAINHLPPQQKKVYLLSRHQRLKYLEIADELCISRETVKKHLQTAIQTITTYVHKHNDAIIIFILIKFFNKF
ncbi:RNA polymerase sigma factor [Mucilaginibacter sp.]|jgi:RNA polymerase sigma-70 factor (ECF subfamily)|uniref:RNA polymerase sigma factor n=1 Tax=Mucilaginibacter sp. TaxID=1882438 RepID=UPI003566DCC8